ncbi:hypothetical protein EB796_020885 [Bugula neritina]|uniref:Casein kinase substrate phosphoprotein PP28 domain-containing protein n=1 Tax=Bugula neritina TaxID=10212 RepID=A0A7J7J3P5_BUGNE|nr:hypothetical protein EB796_020885 [Bugula neritina]
MGRGRKPSRGGSRRFTDIETLKQQSRELERQSARSEESDEDSPSKGASAGDKSRSNPSAPPTNALQQKNKKINDLTLESLEITDPKRGLNRKEREELAKQEAKKKYQALTAAGKTDEAKADLARLAIIRAQREEAAKKRELEQKAKEAAAKAKAEARKKAQSNKI